MKNKILISLAIIIVSSLVSCGKYMPQDIQKAVNKSFVSSSTINIKIDSKFVSKSDLKLKQQVFDSSQKRILVLISSQRCSACQTEHSMIQDYLEDNRLDSSKFQIVSLMIATDFSDSYDFVSVEELIVNSGMTWSIGEDKNLEYFNKLCKGQTTPCSAVLEPGKGMIYSHNGLPNMDELSLLLNK
jgi:hypothetical protein